MGQLTINLLGEPEVTVEGRPIDVDTRKAISLLAYLAIEGSADRDFLATMFWADAVPERARATLRRTLSALRAGIGPEALNSDRSRIELAGEFSCDVSAFNAAIDETADHGHDPGDVCGHCLDPLARAVDLYRGDFLGSFSVKDAPDFEDWTRNMTAALRQRAGETLRRLAHAQSTMGDYPAAIATAGRWVVLDELHEPAHRLLMLLNAWAGDRPGAIEAYRNCVAVLDRELGVAPLEETTELFEAILDEDFPPAPGVRRPVRAVPASIPRRDTGLLDRAEAIESIEGAIAVSRTSSGALFLCGDSWMGKTRLVQHALSRADASGYQTARSSAFRTESSLPYGVAIQLLEGLLELTDDESLQGWTREELSRLMPRLAPGSNPPDPGPLGELRLRDAFLSLVELVTTRRPLMLTVDDAQWVDPASVNLLAHFRRRAADLPVLIIVAAPDLDDLPPSWRNWQADGAEVLLLGPLRPSDIEVDRPADEVHRIIEATGGIPLLVQEALEQEGSSPNPTSVGRYIEARRGRLTDLASQVLTAAAVLAGMCDASLLRDTSGRTDEEIVDAVEELIASGLLREDGDDRLRFTLEAAGKVTYESTSLIRRRLLHKRAADALRAQARSRRDARLAAAVAGHLREAGEEEAAEWYRLAGDLARGVFANQEAANAYEMAIALGHGDVGGLRLALGELAMARGDYEDATRELQAAAAQSNGATLARVEHRLGALHRILGRFDLAEESFARAGEEHPHPSDLYADWALLRDRVGDRSGAIDLASRALQKAVGEGEASRACNVLALVVEDEEEAQGHIDRALAVATAIGPDRMAALNNKAFLVAAAGDHETALRLLEEAIDIAVRAGYRHQHAALLNHLADLHHRAGRNEDAEKALTEAVTIFAEIDAGDWRPEVWLLRKW